MANTLFSLGISLLEKNVLPDTVVRYGIRSQLADRLRTENKGSVEGNIKRKLDFIKELKSLPIAVHQQEANKQHYEVPAEFYNLVLGKNRKYSSCLFTNTARTLDDAEDAMLNLYVERARLQDGMDILDLGCGWGSVSLFMSAKFPNSKVTGLSNSNSQREFIMEEAKKRGIKNLNIITGDVAVFQADLKFDRVVCIEMFEHMKNYEKLLEKISSWLKPSALLFVHIFAHKEFPYHFETDGSSWMAEHFFTGGTMASDDLLIYFQKNVTLIDHWVVDGKNYGRTNEEWLLKFDKNIAQIREIFAKTYGADQVTKWTAYWRSFFLACAELFIYNNGQEWFVSHYLFEKK